MYITFITQFIGMRIQRRIQNNLLKGAHTQYFLKNSMKLKKIGP